MIYIIYYLIIINLLTFIYFWLDKYFAVKQKYRISEKNLFILTALWGFLWAILGMHFFAHKTIKSNFQIKFWIIVVLRILILIFILNQ